MIQRLFHVGCAMILATSVAATIMRAPPNRTSADAKTQLIRFLEMAGFSVTGERALIGDERIFEIKDHSCSQPHQVLFLPAIHRISDRAHAIVATQPRAIIIHAGEQSPTLGAMTLIPRWMIRRSMVNAQLANEDPWISIVLIVITPAGCDSLKLQWNRLGSA